MGFEITSELLALVSIISASIIAIFSLFLGPHLQEKSKIKSEKEMRLWMQSEERFFNMITYLSSFHAGADSLDEKAREKRQLFVEAYGHLWLYSSDEVIRKVNDFLISTGYSKDHETPADKAARDMIYAMRNAIFKDSKLKINDFLIAGVK